MISQTALEESILSLLCFSDSATTIAVRVQDPFIFSNRTNQTIAKTALDYITKFGAAPGIALEYLLEQEYRRGEEGKLLGQSVDLLQKNAGQVQVEFVVAELDRFLKVRSLASALQSAMEALTDGELEVAQETIFKQVTPSLNGFGSPGILLQDPKQAFRFADRQEAEEFFTSGVDYLDVRRIRPERKTLFLFVGITGTGKSWFCIAVGKGGLQYKKKVLHITLELSEEKVAKRYLQSIFSLTADEASKVRIPIFNRADDGTSTIDFQEIERDPILAKRKDIENRLRYYSNHPPIKIKEFPTSYLSFEHLKMYLDMLKRDQNFEPDLLILDMPDNMQINTDQLRIDTGQLYKKLRGLAGERNFALVCPTQSNAEGEKKKLIGGTNVSEDWSKAGTCDILVTFNQTLQEKRLGLARLFVYKGRDSGDKFVTLISQSYDLGQFSIDSIPMNSDVVNTLEKMAEGAKA